MQKTLKNLMYLPMAIGAMKLICDGIINMNIIHIGAGCLGLLTLVVLMVIFK